jgi:hypothetical protein
VSSKYANIPNPTRASFATAHESRDGSTLVENHLSNQILPELDPVQQPLQIVNQVVHLLVDPMSASVSVANSNVRRFLQ